jgi:hypothetical protein
MAAKRVLLLVSCRVLRVAGRISRTPQKSRVELPHVCGRPRSFIGVRTAPQKPANPNKHPENTHAGQITRPYPLPDLDWTHRDLDYRRVLWHRLFLPNSPGETGVPFGCRSHRYGCFLDASPWLLEAMIRLDPLFPEPFARPAQLAGNKAQTGFADQDRAVSTSGGQSAVEIDRRGTALAAPELEGGALFVDPSELARVSPPQSRSSASTSLPSAAESPHSASSRKRHQRPSTETRTPQTHAPVQAIRDVLQKHTRPVK